MTIRAYGLKVYGNSRFSASDQWNSSIEDNPFEKIVIANGFRIGRKSGNICAVSATTENTVGKTHDCGNGVLTTILPPALRTGNGAEKGGVHCRERK